MIQKIKNMNLEEFKVFLNENDVISEDKMENKFLDIYVQFGYTFPRAMVLDMFALAKKAACSVFKELLGEIE
jgi:hypothetical protein